MAVKLINQADVEPITVEEGAVGVRIQWLLDEAAGAPCFSMRRFEIAPGGHTPLHEHPWEHEVYIISGRGAVAAGGRETPLRAEDAVLVHPGERHQFKAMGDEALALLCLVPNGPATCR
jgi:quercetin dioxygenase-like cupin family protein